MSEIFSLLEQYKINYAVCSSNDIVKPIEEENLYIFDLNDTCKLNIPKCDLSKIDKSIDPFKFVPSICKDLINNSVVIELLLTKQFANLGLYITPDLSDNTEEFKSLNSLYNFFKLKHNTNPNSPYLKWLTNITEYLGTILLSNKEPLTLETKTIYSFKDLSQNLKHITLILMFNKLLEFMRGVDGTENNRLDSTIVFYGLDELLSENSYLSNVLNKEFSKFVLIGRSYGLKFLFYM